MRHNCLNFVSGGVLTQVKKLAILGFFATCSLFVLGQGIEVAPLSENYKGLIGETVKVPLVIRNTDSKAVTLIIRRTEMQIGTTQKNYLCLDEACVNQKAEEVIVRLEPGQETENLFVALDGGLVAGFSHVRYTAFSRSDPAAANEIELNFSIDEQPARLNIYNSRHITLEEVYPNPVVDEAYFKYRILNDQIKAKIAVHNILGNVLGEYELSVYETSAKIRTDDLSPGIYFYTLYVNNESVITRKLIVRKQ